MKLTPVGIDIAKSVFQVHHVDEGTGEIVNNDHGVLISKDATDKEIAEVIHAIYSVSEDEYLALRHKSRRFWKDYFDADKNYHDFFEELASIK